MYKLHCDLCDRDLSKDENTTRLTWEDNNGYETSSFFVFRKPRKFSVDICDKCLEFLKQKGHYENSNISKVQNKNEKLEYKIPVKPYDIEKMTGKSL